MRLRHRLVLATVVAALFASAGALATTAPPASAAGKALGGELQCPPGDRVTGIWLLGSRSGWHGFNYPSNKLPYVGSYAITAVQGETIKAWIRCRVSGESYSTFPVGRGSTRHICYRGWTCVSVNLGGCAIKAAFTGLSIRVVGCFVRYGR